MGDIDAETRYRDEKGDIKEQIDHPERDLGHGAEVQAPEPQGSRR